MKINMQGLINRLDSLRERLDDLCDNLDILKEEGQEEIEITEGQQYFQTDDTFNLSIALDVLEQADKLDRALEIIEEKSVDVHYLKVCFTDKFGNGCVAYNRWKQDNENNYLTQEEYDLLKEVL